IPGEGFDEVIIGADVQTLDAVVESVLGGDAVHRRTVPALAHLTQDREAVLTGQHNVQRHAVVAMRREELVCLETIEREIDIEAFFTKAFGNRSRKRWMVLGDEVSPAQFSSQLVHGTALPDLAKCARHPLPYLHASRVNPYPYRRCTESTESVRALRVMITV